jgi:subtilisin family serine protease
MSHRTPRRLRLPLVAIVFAGLLSALISYTPAPAVVAQGSVTASPGAISVTVPLGGKVSQLLQIVNGTSAPTTPLLYKAQPAAPPTLALAEAAPIEAHRVPLPQQADKFDPQLDAEFGVSEAKQADFLVYLAEQADLSAAYRITDWAERGRYVYQALADTAEHSQRDVRAQLEARGADYTPLWIVNALLVRGTQADAQSLAARADVALVRANHTMSLPPDQEVTAISPALDNLCSPDQPGNPVCWNIRRLGADRVWRDFGVTGKGVVVANIDTGVQGAHPSLANQYRGNLGGGSFDHNYNWFDPQGAQPAPFDSGSSGHGTHTMGTIVGSGNSADGRPYVGVAPDARWMTAQGCEITTCVESDLIQAAQWMLAPTNLDGTQPRPDLRPMIINNSWSGPGDNNWYAGYTTAWRAAGIFPVFAAGNADGIPSCGSVNSPGDYANVVAVGATDGNDRIAGFSTFGPTKDSRLKPDFVAPGTYGSGVNILSTVPAERGTYSASQGTSMAAPHVAGVVALLWSANPTLIGDYDATYRILSETAQQIGDTRCGDAATGPNNVFGRGLINAYSAVSRAQVDIPWMTIPSAIQALPANSTAEVSVTLDAGRVPGPGTYRARLLVFGSSLADAPTPVDVTMSVLDAAQQVSVRGQVTDAGTGAPIQATVGVKDGLSVATDSSGRYTLTLAPGSYELIARAPAFFTTQRAITISQNLDLNISLQPDQPRLASVTERITTELPLGPNQQISIPISNTGTRPLVYQVQPMPDAFGIWRSDEPDGPAYNWIDLPPESPALQLGDTSYSDAIPLGMAFPFYGKVFTQAQVTSDGMLVFDRMIAYSGLTTRCLPEGKSNLALVAPLRADLDPTSGRIRYDAINGGAVFVLSYENVVLRDTGASVTFQVLLRSDGSVMFQYKQLGVLPTKLSVGLQGTPAMENFSVMEIGCGTTTPIRDGLALEFRPQIFAEHWLLSSAAGQTLQPGVSGQLTATLAWVRPIPQQPYRGRLLVTSSDPTRARWIIPVQVVMQPAPNEMWLPVVGRRS